MNKIRNLKDVTTAVLKGEKPRIIEELRLGPRNLKKYLGLPPVDRFNGYTSKRAEDWEDWSDGWGMDHVKLERITNTYRNETWVALVSEPYSFDDEQAQRLVELCRKYNLEFSIDVYAEHNRGHCLHIEVTKRKTEEQL